MALRLSQILRNVKEELPEVAIIFVFSRSEGLVLDGYSWMPDLQFDKEYASAVHSFVIQTFEEFLSLLPEELVGDFRSVLLETGIANFQLTILNNPNLVLGMAAPRNVGLGLFRTIIRKYNREISEAV